MQNLRRVGKNYGPVLSRLWIEVHDILRRRKRPLVVSMAVALDYVYLFGSEDIGVKVVVNLQSRQKGWFRAPICRGTGGGIHQISEVRFQIAFTSEHVTGFG